MDSFRFRFRVRYHECDAQKIVFNARWGEYVDVAVTEYCRILGDVMSLDWRLVRQVVEWKASARYDEVIDASVRTLRVGNTSFAIATDFARGGEKLVSAETVYVLVDEVHGKRPVPDAMRAALEGGAPGVVVDASGVTAPSP